MGLWRSSRIGFSSAPNAELNLFSQRENNTSSMTRTSKTSLKRCKACKSKRQAGPSGAGKTETTTVCSQCGRETTVPFKPTQGRPVFCRECFLGRKAQAAGAG